VPPPPWQEISGLTVEAEGKMTRSERRFALRKLFRHYEKLVREALEEHEKDPEKEERTFLWDPVPMLCIELGISRRKLSALTRELTGMAAHEVVDRVRAEKVVTRMEDDIAGILNQWYTPGGDHRIKGSWWGDDLREAVREQRREDGFDGCAWALLHGFPNYARFRRGCMLAHAGQTPRALEEGVLTRYAKYFAVASSLRYRHAELQDVGKRAKRARKPCADSWAEALRERPEWLKEMRERLGLSKELEPMAEQIEFPPPDEEAAAYLRRVAEIAIESKAREEKERAAGNGRK
jgi:AraC-like DNA-binding protein